MIEENLLKSNYVGKDGFIWWIGQVAEKSSWGAEANMSVKGQWGSRCKVRIIGYHPFSGDILEDKDLPWAHIMIDPAFGSAQGGYGTTLHLTGGETVFGFFLDGDDGQQPVIVGLLYRSEATKNLINPEIIAKENSSRFKPFTGHKNKVVKPSQINSRVGRDIPIGTPPEETVGTSTTSTGTPTDTQTGNRETYPFTVDKLPSFSGIGTFPFDIDIYNSPNITSGFSTLPLAGVGGTSLSGIFNGGDIIAGLYCNSPSSAVMQIMKKGDITLTPSNGCQNNLIGQITQALQDFMAITNGLDKYLNLYIDPVLNVFTDIQSVISSTARIIGGVIKLILNNLRDTIFKCLSWAFRKLVGIIVPLPQQTIVLESMKNILNIIFCAIEKLMPELIDMLENMLSDLVDKLINVPLCAAEQWTASILSQVMSSIDNALSDILSGVSWLTGKLGDLYSILNQASSLASQIFSFLECTGQACTEPGVWASKFGVQSKSADNWEKMVSNVNVFNGISTDLQNVEGALSQIPMYGNNVAFNECNQRVYNPTNQNDIMPLKIGNKWSKCIPPEISIIGDGIGAKAIPVVADDSSIFSINIINGGTGYTDKNTSVNIIDNSGYGSNARAVVKVGAGGSIQSIYLKTRGSGYCKGNTSILVGITTTYDLTINKDFVYEGEDFIATLTTKNVPDNTKIQYTISGVQQNRIVQNLVGNFRIKNNSSSIKFRTISNNVFGDDGLLKITAGEAEDYIAIRSGLNPKNEPTTPGGGTGITTVMTYSLNANKTSIDRGDSVTITLTTKNVRDGVNVPYRITGVDSNDITNNLTGTFVISSNRSSIVISSLKYNQAHVKLLNLILDNRQSNISVRLNSYNEASTGISTFIFGCLDEFLITSPGYGYTSGDTVTDGVNVWNIITSPISGAVVGVLPKSTPVCGLTNAPEVYINTNTGIGAEVIPQMRYTPADNTLLQDQQRLIRLSGIAVTSVVDCV